MPSDKDRSMGLTRRDFHRKAAGAAMVLAFGASVASSAQPADKQNDSDAWAEVILEQVPGLPESDQDELRRQVKNLRELARSLENAQLADGVEPGFVFSALLEGDRVG